MSVRVAVPTILGSLLIAGTVAASHLLGGGASVGETSCTRLVHDYLASVARDGGTRIIQEQVQACRQDGNQAVARVRLLVEQTVFDPFSARLSKERSRLVVVIRFAKSPWQVVSAKVAG